MEYNTQREDLLLPEYGRNVQRMVADLLAIEDRAERTKRARMVMRVMLMLVPNLRSQEDHEQRVWDHLCLLAGGELDVDLPYPPPAPQVEQCPQTVPYPSRDGCADHYGRVARGMLVALASNTPSEPIAQGLARRVANQMKRGYLQWNRNTVTDEEILADAARICGSTDLLSPTTRLVEGMPTALRRHNPRLRTQQGGTPREGRRHRRGKGGRA